MNVDPSLQLVAIGKQIRNTRISMNQNIFISICYNFNQWNYKENMVSIHGWKRIRNRRISRSQNMCADYDVMMWKAHHDFSIRNALFPFPSLLYVSVWEIREYLWVKTCAPLMIKAFLFPSKMYCFCLLVYLFVWEVREYIWAKTCDCSLPLMIRAFYFHQKCAFSVSALVGTSIRCRSKHDWWLCSHLGNTRYALLSH